MKIKEWEVSGYRSLRHGSVPCSDFNILIGKNNSGKSNVMDSLLDYSAFLRDDLDLSPWFTEHVSRKNDIDSIEFDVSFELGAEERSTLIEELASRDVFGETQAEEWLSSDNFSEIRHQVRITAGQIPQETFQTNIEDSMVDLARSSDPSLDTEVLVLENLPTITYTTRPYRLDLSFKNLMEDSLSQWQTLRGIRKPEGVMDILRTTSLDEAGEKLAQVLSTLSINSPDTFREIAENYQSIMEGVTRVEGHLLDDGEVTIEVYEEGFSEAFELDEISAGSQQILMLLTAIILSKENSDVLLVEEPELHLHPGAEQHIYDLLQDVSLSGTQVFVTTHSDTFVNESGTEDILSVSRNDENFTEIEIVGGPEIDDALSMLGYEKSDVYYSNAVVFVEGQSDKVVFEQFADTLGYSLNERGIRFVRLEGTNMYADAEPMLKIIRQLRMPFLFILDSDKENPEEKAESVASDLGVSPENVYVLKKPVIESYLVENPEPIRRAFNIEELEKVIGYIEKAGKRNHAEVLNRICKEELDQSLSKKAVNGIVARHTHRGEIPGELDRLLRQIRDMV